MSYEDAQAYIRWLSQRSGRTYRLPSEAEWEYAARAGTTSARFWGDGPGEACQYANVADVTKAEQHGWRATLDTVHLCRTGHAVTAPVASFAPNRFGLYDMLGNAWQWVEDCWHDNYAGRPTDEAAWPSGGCNTRVVRGGSWRDRPQFVRAAERDRGRPSVRSAADGFRVARTLAP
jgi:formylglycine-generating enzyme required for sulfatase activity